MTTTHAESESSLRSSLERLEDCLLSPVVSGELTSWVDEVRHVWADAAAQIREHVEALHPRQYDEISAADPELLPLTEKLQAEDAELAEQCEEYARSIQRFAEHAPKFEPDEEKIAEHTRVLVDEGIQFITRVRKQEAALQTWFVEAFTRDRGVAD